MQAASAACKKIAGRWKAGRAEGSYVATQLLNCFWRIHVFLAAAADSNWTGAARAMKIEPGFIRPLRALSPGTAPHEAFSLVQTCSRMY